MNEEFNEVIVDPTVPTLTGWDSVTPEQIEAFLDNIELLKYIGLYLIGTVFGLIALAIAVIFFVAWRS